jgi:hypothetical protein
MFNNELWTVTNRCLRISIMSTRLELRVALYFSHWVPRRVVIEKYPGRALRRSPRFPATLSFDASLAIFGLGEDT